jgi:hypothetical protein
VVFGLRQKGAETVAARRRHVFSLDLAAWMDLGLRGDEYIEADENEPLKKRVGQFFLKRDKTLIDGKQLQPILDRTAFVKYSMTGSTFLVQPEQLPINTAMVGVIITYLTQEIPQQVTNEWNLWSEHIQKVPADAIDPAGPFPSYVTPDDNVLTWTNFLKTYQMPAVAEIEVDASLTKIKIPAASALCLLAVVPLGWRIGKRRKNAGSIGLHLGLAVVLIAGSVVLYPYLKVAVARPAAIAPKMTDRDAVAVLNSLLKNIYRSFDFREEEDVYDRLATSVSGDLLSEIYLQNRKSLVVTQAGGARARVKAIEMPRAPSATGATFTCARISMRPISPWSRWTGPGRSRTWSCLKKNALILMDEIDFLVLDFKNQGIRVLI